MVDAGVQANFVDTQDVTLTNVPDSLTYTQLTDVELILSRTFTKHQLTDDTIDNIPSLKMISIRGNMVLTNPEIPALVDLYISSEARLWKIDYTDFSNTNKNITTSAKIFDFHIIDSGADVTRAFIHLEGNEVLSVA